jgi:ABC-type iron transport system FetAB ATPase subunit
MPVELLTVKTLRYGGLGPVSLTLAPGECLGISGPSGCGKTRLLRALADLEPWSGDVQLSGVSPNTMDAHAWRCKVMWLPSESQWWGDTVGSDHFPVNVEEAIAGHLCELGFEPEVMTWPLSRLSSGEKQRLALVRALVRFPRILLLDEPTAHLDAENEKRVEACIARLRNENKIGVLWVSHDQEQLRRVADRVLSLPQKEIA